MDGYLIGTKYVAIRCAVPEAPLKVNKSPTIQRGILDRLWTAKNRVPLLLYQLWLEKSE